MKLLISFILFSVLNVSGSIFSQSTTFDLAVSGKTVKEVFRDIEQQSQFRFLYNDDFDGLNRIVSLNANNQRIDEVLSGLLSEGYLTYRELENDLIVITPCEHSQQDGQDGHQVTGTVTDIDGDPLPGVTVIVEGTTIGTVTDVDGNYSLTVPSATSVLVFSFVGFANEVVLVENRTVIEVMLVADIIGLDEVVVIGYGTQREGTITGSVSRVDEESLARVSTPTVAQSLQGQTAGVFIKHSDAQPGENKTQINIRGFGTPLLIVDGMPVSLTEFQEIDPNDIQDMNVLKDAASAAVFGARAGNGVIIVRTKRGMVSAPQFTFKSELAAQYFLPGGLGRNEPVNSHEYMMLRNFVEENEGRSPMFSRELIENYKLHADGSEPELYPNVNMWEEALRDYAPMTNNNLSVRGGSENFTYYVSGNWMHQQGMEISGDTKYNRYSLRSNADIRLTDRLEMGVDFSLLSRDFIGPRNSIGSESWGEGQGWSARARRWRPWFSIEPWPDPAYPRGSPGGETVNPINTMYIDIVGYTKYDILLSDTKLSLNYDLPGGFSARGLFNYSRNDNRWKQYQKRGPEYNYDAETGEYTFTRAINARDQLIMRDELRTEINAQAFLEYDQIFADDHALRGLFVVEYLSNELDAFEASRLDYEFNIDQLFAGPEGRQFNNSHIRQGGRMGYIGRLAYNYAGKYSIETSARLDGSPQFPEDGRWGFFPSASAAWIITEEPFLQDIAQAFINLFKIRASYGQLGYDAAGDWQYLATYRLAGGYIFSGDQLERGIRTDAIPNPMITWETMTLANLGVDFVIFDGLLDGLFDIFRRDRTNVLGTRIRDIPDVVGAVMPQENYREYRNEGWDLMLNHSNRIGEATFRIGVNLSYNFETVQKIDEPDYANKEIERRNSRIGKTSDRYLRLPTAGVFKTQEEIDNWACIDGRNNASILPGDVKFIDTNGDGRITSEDAMLAGTGTMPRLSYGLNASASWRGFDFFMSWQGAALYGFDLSTSELSRPFHGNGPPLQHHYHNSYIPENDWVPANLNGRWPIPQTGWGNRSYRASEFWWINGRYLRLRQLQMAYTIPSRLMTPVGIRNLRVFISAYNLLTFSELDFMDPEIDTSPRHDFGHYYPQTGSFHVGIDLNF